jgi:hypothetical protein
MRWQQHNNTALRINFQHCGFDWLMLSNKKKHVANVHCLRRAASRVDHFYTMISLQAAASDRVLQEVCLCHSSGRGVTVILQKEHRRVAIIKWTIQARA